jgi:hypothetical protein
MQCKDCGLFLDAFGICPQACPEKVTTTRAPVFCGRRLDEVSRLAIAQAAAMLEQMKSSSEGHSIVDGACPLDQKSQIIVTHMLKISRLYVYR